MRTTLIKGCIAGRRNPSAILIRNEKIVSTDWTEAIPDGTQIFDYHDDLILPAFVDPHIHGGGGFDFVDMTPESFEEIIKTHRSHGTMTVCPTLVSSSWEKTLKFLDFCVQMKSTPGFGGIHLEGPFLSPEKSGAQNPDRLILPTARAAEELLQYKSVLKRVTLAPELVGARAFAERLKAEGISLSIGHSAADADTVRAALDWGFDQVTHLFSGTSQRHKIGSYVHGGIEETALINDSFTVELIADGHHVCKESFLMALRCKGSRKIVAVSDAMRAAGCEGVEESFLGECRDENRVIVEDGVAKLPDRSSFAGSITVGDEMLRVLLRYGISVADASRMLSETPADMLGLIDSIGTLEPGKLANILVFNKDYQVISAFQCGNKII